MKKKKKSILRSLKSWSEKKSKFRSIMKKKKPVVVKIKENRPVGYRSGYFKEEWVNAQKKILLD